MKFKLISAERTGLRDVILVGRSAERKCTFRVVDFHPYFYKPGFGEYKGIDGRVAKKVVCLKVEDVKRLRGDDSYEADIIYTQRFLIDIGIYSGFEVPDNLIDQPLSIKDITPCDVSVEPKKVYMDIETEDLNTKDPGEIFCITIYHNGLYETFIHKETEKMGAFVSPIDNSVSKHVIHTYAKEKQMLLNFCSRFREINPDAVLGWNVRDFDVKYLLRRLKKVGLTPEMLSPVRKVNRDLDAIRGLIMFDMLTMYKKLQEGEIQSYRLDAIVEKEFGADMHKKAHMVQKWWSHNPERLVIYNTMDVDACVQIDKKLNLYKFYEDIAQAGGVLIDDTIVSSRIADSLMLRLKEERMVLPTKGKRKKLKEYKGAIVFEPPKGIFQRVAVYDLKRLYPSIILAYNISPETISPCDGRGCKHARSPIGVCFDTQKEGLLPRVIKHLIALRDKYDRMRKEDWDKYNTKVEAVKRTINAMTGVFGNPGFRLYNTDVIGSITGVGRELTETLYNRAKERGYNVLYGDTDSLHVELPDGVDPIDVHKEITQDIHTYCDRKGIKHTLTIEYERLFDKVFYGGKKRYAGMTDEGKLIIKGFEYRRSDASAVTRQFQKDLFRLIFAGDPQGVARLIQERYNQIVSGKVPIKDIAFPETIRKPLGEYKSKQPHVAGALYSNKYFGTNFGENSKVYWIYVKYTKAGLPPTNVLCLDEDCEVPQGVSVDLQKMALKTITEKANALLEVLRK